MRKHAYHHAARVTTRTRNACRYHATGTFCTGSCDSCESRMLERQDRARIAGDARQHLATDRLMRQARTR